jgi:hypothetical protein
VVEPLAFAPTQAANTEESFTVTMHTEESNVHWLKQLRQNRPNSALLDEVKSLIASVTQNRSHTEEQCRRAVAALELANWVTHELIERIGNEQARSECLARHAVLVQLTDVVHQKLPSLPD